MNAKYAEHKPQSIPRRTSSARTKSPGRTPRRHQSLASLATDKTATAKATSRIAHTGGQTTKPITFNACL